MRNNNNNCTANQLINNLLIVIVVGMNYAVIAFLIGNINKMDKTIYTSPAVKQIEMYK